MQVTHKRKRLKEKGENVDCSRGRKKEETEWQGRGGSKKV